MSALNCIVFAVACGLALGPERSAAQQRTTIAVDATLGAGVGKGGEFFDRRLGGVRIAGSVRRSAPTGVGVFGELAMDWLGLSLSHHLVCFANPRGGCLPSYPEFSGPTATVGLIAKRADKFELRLGLGGGAYGGDGPRVGAAISQLDATWFPATHVGVVAGARWIVVPRFRGDRLSVLPWMAGLRFRF